MKTYPHARTRLIPLSSLVVELGPALDANIHSSDPKFELRLSICASNEISYREARDTSEGKALVQLWANTPHEGLQW